MGSEDFWLVGLTNIPVRPVTAAAAVRAIFACLDSFLIFSPFWQKEAYDSISVLSQYGGVLIIRPSGIQLFQHFHFESEPRFSSDFTLFLVEIPRPREFTLSVHLPEAAFGPIFQDAHYSRNYSTNNSDWERDQEENESANNERNDPDEYNNSKELKHFQTPFWGKLISLDIP